MSSYNNPPPFPARGAITPVGSLDLSRLQGNLPVAHRHVEWRGAFALPIVTVMQRKACKIYTHGTVVNHVPCTRCVNGSGPFRRCVVAWDNNGYIAKGVCANCYWQHRTDVCSRRHDYPCKALADAGRNLGDFASACEIACGGIHLPGRQVEQEEEEEEEEDDEEDGGSGSSGSKARLEDVQEDEAEDESGNEQHNRSTSEGDFDELESIKNDHDNVDEGSDEHDGSDRNQRESKSDSKFDSAEDDDGGDSSDDRTAPAKKRRRSKSSEAITYGFTAINAPKRRG